jgi:hypothetical protein
MEFYRKFEVATGKKIPGCIFAEKLVEWLRAQSSVLRAKNKCECESEF